MTLPDSGRVEATDSFFPSVRALNGIGDSLPATFFWSSLDTAIIQVLDSTTGVSLGKTVGTGRLQVRVDALRSNPQNVFVIARLDSMAPTDPTRTHDTLDVTPTDSTVDSLSNPLKISTVAFGGNASNRRIVYTVAAIYPDTGAVVTLSPKDTVATAADGTASVQVRLRPGPLPDSVVVQATMQKFHGGPLPGSPVTFVVEFRP